MKIKTLFLMLTVFFASGSYATDSIALFVAHAKPVQDALILELNCRTDNTSEISYFANGIKQVYPIQDRFCAHFNAKFGKTDPCSIRHADLVLLDDKKSQLPSGTIRVVGIFNQRVETFSCL